MRTFSPYTKTVPKHCIFEHSSFLGAAKCPFSAWHSPRPFDRQIGDCFEHAPQRRWCLPFHRLMRSPGVTRALNRSTGSWAAHRLGELVQVQEGRSPTLEGRSRPLASCLYSGPLVDCLMCRLNPVFPPAPIALRGVQYLASRVRSRSVWLDKGSLKDSSAVLSTIITAERDGDYGFAEVVSEQFLS